jgi:hypothetical protein
MTTVARPAGPSLPSEPMDPYNDYPLTAKRAEAGDTLFALELRRLLHEVAQLRHLRDFTLARARELLAESNALT